MRNSLFAAALLTLSVAVAPACATKKYVRTEVGNVNSKVDTLAGTVEETQERTRKNEERIGQVDQKAEEAGKSATAARTAADQANAAAQKVDGRVTTVDNRVSSVEAAARKLIFEVTLSEDQGNFKFGKAELPDQAKAQIDDMISKLKADPKNIFIEIEGHTDNVGDAKYNERLGEMRAEAVKRYLYEQHQVPLHKMNVISYGEQKPATDNKTKDGRAQNRRVVIKVLA